MSVVSTILDASDWVVDLLTHDETRDGLGLPPRERASRPRAWDYPPPPPSPPRPAVDLSELARLRAKNAELEAEAAGLRSRIADMEGRFR